MINQLINNVPRLLKFREINFHELEKKREIRENLATRKFPSIRYLYNEALMKCGLVQLHIVMTYYCDTVVTIAILL